MLSPMSSARLALRVLSVALAAAALAGCGTTAGGPAAESKAPEPPMTHTRAARECWMATEKGHADMSLDKRADVVDKCIKEKMQAAKAAPAG